MGIYSKYVLPRVVHHVCGQKPAMKQRGKIIPLAEGRVLEVGIGSGLNIPYYDSERVSHLWGLDPSREAWAIARRNAREHHLDAEFIEAGAESIPLDNDSADTVVMTYTMCTIPEVPAALAEIRRVLKPGGRVVCLDTSRSMLVEDLRPSRLERAKREIVGLLQKLKGDRVAVLAFADLATALGGVDPPLAAVVAGDRPQAAR